MRVLIAGGGIGGLSTALSLHALGIEAEVFEQAPEMRELGVGVTLLPHAVKELAALGLLPELDRAGIRTREIVFMNRFGQVVWQEPRGLHAGYQTPQFNIHRGRLLKLLHEVLQERVGASRIHTGHRLLDFKDHGARVSARFRCKNFCEYAEFEGDALIGADGIHSTVRSLLYPGEPAPSWSGLMLWRGATDWPAWRDGETMAIAGGNAAKLVFYPVHVDPATPQLRQTNWAVMARTDAAQPPQREDWNRPGRLDEALHFVRDAFRLDFVDLARLIEATATFYEFPVCDRDPLPRWSSGRVTLLGDAAHPMYPTGSNGAGQAILDARSIAGHLACGAPVDAAFEAYDAERRPKTAEIVYANRKGGSEGVIDLVEARAPQGFDNIEDVASYAEREAIVRGYAAMAGYSQEQVNARG